MEQGKIKESILYEDNHLIILNKKAGLLSQGDKTGDSSVIDILKNFIKIRDEKPGNVYLGLPHRLDRPVSGAIIACKTSKSLERMNALFRKQEIIKKYHALCLNAPPDQQAQIVSYVKKDTSRNKVKCASREFPGSKKAILNYTYLSEFKNSTHLIEVELKTGRPHQIRVQLNSINCPILGDMKYYSQKALSDKSIALHSRYLEFIHPVKKEKIQISAPYPDKNWWK